MKLTDPRVASGLTRSADRDHLRHVRPGCVGVLLSLLIFGLGSACGDQVVGFPAEDTEPPTVTSTTPSSDANDVALNAAISVTFSEAMDPATFSNATIRLAQGTTSIAGEVTYTGLTALYVPPALLAPDTLYSVTVSRSVTDLAGNAMLEDYVWTFTTGSHIDVTRPQVSATVPPAGAISVSLNTAVSATFTEEMNPESINEETFLLHDGDNSVDGTVTYSGMTATFRPTDPLDRETVYTARITNEASDLTGNTMAADHVWEFTTGALSDAVAPEVISTVPARDATGVAISGAVSATFSEAMDPPTISTATFTLADGETQVPGTVSYSGVTATFVPTEWLEGDTLYTATVSASVRDLAGNELGEDYTWTFTTGTSPDTTAPTVISTSPDNGALDAPFDAPLTATFSEPMLASTITSASFQLFDGATLIPGTVSYSGVVATLEPTDPLEAFTTYTARISETVEDLSGNEMGEDYVWSFTTGLVPDTTPPFVVSTAPGSGATNVPLNTRIIVTFSEEMDAATMVPANFDVREGTDPVPGSVAYSGLIATFTPDSPFDPMLTHTVTVMAEVTDLAGNEMDEDYTWSFDTGETPDTQPPRVTSTTPADDAMGVSLNSSISVVFSEAMDASTISADSFTVQQLDTVVDGTVSYSGLTATFTPSSPLEPLTTYSAAMTTSATDLAGNELVENYVWNFRTGMTTDATAPLVLATVPSDGDSDVPLNSTVTVVFSEPMDALTINASSFTLVDEDEEVITGSITLVGSTAVFVPSGDLDELTEYTGTVTTDAADLAGNALEEAYVWSFTTGTTLDVDAPFVLSTSPDDGDTEVLLDTTVSATFSESMDPLTINTATLELLGPGATLVIGTVTYDVLTNTATFQPGSDLLPETEYEATITADVADLAGNAIEEEYVWTFTTGGIVFALDPVNLRSLESFVAVAGAGLTNSNSGGTTTLGGDVGLSPTGTCIGDGEPCTITNPVITGVLYANDPEGIAAQAKTDLTAAFVDAMSRPPGTVVADVAGLVLAPGVYTSESTISMAVGGTVTLDGQGDENAVWIFQAGSSITINNDAQVLIINEGQAGNVFWAAGASSTIGSNVNFQGNVLAEASNSVGTGSSVLGRLLCITGQITLLSNTITLPPN